MSSIRAITFAISVLPDAGVALDEQRLAQRGREVHGRRDRRVGDVLRGLHQLLDLPDLFAHDVRFYTSRA